MKGPSLTKILVTGGAGFIASEFVRQAGGRGFRPVVVDKLTYAGDLARLAPVKKRIRFYRADITDQRRMDTIFEKERPAAIVHFAAETHVDRSILDDTEFWRTNVVGTSLLIQLARKYRVRRFLQVSTDEVYGERLKGRANEDTPLNPGNPYSASKAAADLMIKAAVRTFGLPAVIVRPCNNYGPWQYPEKLIPVVIVKALSNQKVPVYAEGRNVREWLHVADCADAISCVLAKGRTGETYNISSHDGRANIETVRQILKLLDKPQRLIRSVADRPGHDLRYASSSEKLRRLGWRPQLEFKTGLAATVAWYKNNGKWSLQKRKLLYDYWGLIYKDTTAQDTTTQEKTAATT